MAKYSGSDSFFNLNKLTMLVGGAGIFGMIGWQLLTSQVFVTQYQLNASMELLRTERAEQYIRKDVMTRIEDKLDKMSEDIVTLKIKLAELRKEVRR